MFESALHFFLTGTMTIQINLWCCLGKWKVKKKKIVACSVSAKEHYLTTTSGPSHVPRHPSSLLIILPFFVLQHIPPSYGLQKGSMGIHNNPSEIHQNEGMLVCIPFFLKKKWV
jgi:hypothetical protein